MIAAFIVLVIAISAIIDVYYTQKYIVNNIHRLSSKYGYPLSHILMLHQATGNNIRITEKLLQHGTKKMMRIEELIELHRWNIHGEPLSKQTIKP